MPITVHTHVWGLGCYCKHLYDRCYIFLCLPAYVQPKKAAEKFFVTKFYEKWYTYVFERAERDGNVGF